LTNLGGNAIKFTSHGEVVLTVRVMERHHHAVVLEFAMRDSGIGIAPEKQQLIFSGFSQAESNTTRRFGGTGLGLSISKRLVNLMGSELKLDSTLGKGSTIYFQVRFDLAPVSKGHAQERLPAPARKPGDSRRLNGMRILVVEDNKINQLVAQGLLSQEGARVTLAENGQLGVAAVAQANPLFDVVLMDLQMPVMDGYTATRAIRQELGLADLPIVAMTANAMASDRAACLEAGMNDHVGKPFELDHLVALLLQHTGHVESPAVAAETKPPPSDADLPKALDVDSALSRMGGNTVVFASILEAFTRDAVLIPDQLTIQLTQAQSADAIRTLHTLKGLAATVGATQLAQLAAQLETRAKAGITPSDQSEVVAQLREAIDAAAKALQPTLEQLSAEPEPDNGTETTAAQLHADMAALLDLLSHSNLQALDVFDKMLRDHAQQWSEVLLPLGQAIGRLDFAAAAALCETHLTGSAG
jgi:CheY-like chemotaxis protein